MAHSFMYKYYLFIFWCLVPVFSSSCFAQNTLAESIKKATFYYQTESVDAAKADSLAIAYYNMALSQAAHTYIERLWHIQAHEQLGNIYLTNSQAKAAVDHYRLALSLSEHIKYSLENKLRLSIFLANALYQNGQFEPCYQQLLFVENNLPKVASKQLAGYFYNTFGALQFQAGDYLQSKNYFLKAQLLEDTEADFSFKNNLALSLKYLGQPDSAISVYKTLAKKFPAEAHISLNLAACYLDKHQAAEALKYLHKAATNSSIHGQSNFYNLWGKYHLLTAHWAEADKYFTLALAKASSTADKAEVLNNMGLLYTQKKDYNRAIEYFEKAAQYAKNSHFLSFSHLSHQSNHINCLENLYRLKSGKALEKKIENQYKLLTKSSIQLSKSFTALESRLALKKNIHQYFNAAAEFHLSQYQNGKDPSELLKAFAYADQAKALVLGLTRSENLNWKKRIVPPKLLEQERALEFALNSQKRLEQQGQSKVLNDLEIRLAGVRSQIKQLLHAKSALNLDDSLNYGAMALNTPVMSYFEGPKTQGFFLWCGKNKLTFTNISNFSAFSKAVHVLKKELNSLPYHHWDSHLTDAAQLIYKALVENTDLLKHSKQLIFIADGILEGLPLELLQDDENKYLVEKMCLSYHYAARFCKPTQIARQQPNILAVAAFAQPVPTLQNWALPSSAAEVQAIGATKILLNERANKVNFLQNMPQYNSLHLATHAIGDTLLGDNSYILFYANGAIDQANKLYSNDIPIRTWAHLRLLYLSACEGFKGQQLSGEGLKGLSWSFFLAGCRQIVSSVWAAEDHSSRYLASKFYEYYSDGASAEMAMQKAKVSLLNDASMVQYRHPKYWAHLICLGHSGTSAWPSQTINYWIILLAFLATIIILKYFP